MSGPITALHAAMQARWTARSYTATPLLYGFREAARTKDLDAVVLGNGRIVYHRGSWPGPDASAGQYDPAHHHAHRAGRDFAAYGTLFTVHCHGFNPLFPDATSAGGEVAHDDAAWLLEEMFFGVLQWVVRANTWKLEYGSPIIVRDPQERRLGELVRAEFTIKFAMREAPEYPFQYPEVKPNGAVIGASGNENPIVET
jgi:hypothetical protein